MTKKFFVYFKDFPAVLDSFVRQDGHMTIMKDGVRPMGVSSRAIRLTVLVGEVSIVSDRDRERNLVNLLDELQSNGQIITYSPGAV